MIESFLLASTFCKIDLEIYGKFPAANECSAKTVLLLSLAISE
jgi:hypothetical protein